MMGAVAQNRSGRTTTEPAFDDDSARDIQHMA